jgi:signal transduction histidine kinase
MKKMLFTCFVLLFSYNLFAQTNADSLVNVLETKKLTVKEQLDIYRKLCSAYEDNNIEKFKMYAEKGLSLAERENDKARASGFYLYMGANYENYGTLDSAMVCYEKGLKLAIETKNKECEAWAYRKLGKIHYGNRQYKDENLALEYLLKALKVAEEIGNKQDLVLPLSSISEYHRFLKNTERAKYYAERAKAIAEEINYDKGKIFAYYTLGEICSAQGEDDKAIEYYLKMLALSQAVGNKKTEIFSLQSLAYIYCLGKEDLDKAEKYATECLRLAKEFGTKNALITAYTALSYVYIYQQRYDDCKTAVLNAWKIDSLNIQISTLTNLAAAYLYSGEVEKAHSFFVEFVYYLEEYSDMQFQKAIADMDIKYETEKKEMRIAFLEKEKTLYYMVGISGTILLLLALALLYLRHRLNSQKRKMAEQQIKQLEQEKQLITTQAVLDGETTERSRLARDLHDGLGGMLSAVKLNLKDMKGYATMDSSDVECFDKALNMLDQSIGELRRVAHHIMPESLMRYGLKVSLEDFCRVIPGAYFQYLGEDIRLDSRQEIVIYRCAYELVNNAIKHAHATTINVQLMIDNGIISLTVHDNGIGFDPQTVNSGIGLENIRTRIAIYNGKMFINSSPDAGTEISIEIDPS